MHVLRAAQAARFELPGVAFTAAAAPSRGSADVCTWLLTVEPGLESPNAHVIDQDEIFTVIAGAIRLAPGGDVALAGDTIIVPAGENIQVANPGAEPARVVVVIRSGFTATGDDGVAIGTPPWAR